MIGVTSYMAFKIIAKDPNANLTTTTITKGDVVNTVSVSGAIESNNVADLAFPSSGIVSKIYTKEGDQVKKGDVLATLGAEELIATRASALADLRSAQADLKKLISGSTNEERVVTDRTVSIAQADLTRITEAQNTNVENARRSLLNTTLSAYSEKTTTFTSAPIISGTYTCKSAGAYKLSIYSSGSLSGYSISLSGLETGTYPATISQETKFGNCGLYAKFAKDSPYIGTVWTVEVPNTTSSTYTVNKNTYDKAMIDASNAITAAKQALQLAQDKQGLANANPRSEAVDIANARISSALAQISRIDAQIGNRAITAPFDGTVANVDILVGETAGLSPVFSILSTENFELVARVPEVDVIKIKIGQTADVIFDAKSDTLIKATISYISPIPSQINGVAYFIVKLKITDQLEWIRSGLNADIDIITDKKENVLKVPKIYINHTDNNDSLQVLTGELKSTSTIKVLFTGNDGFSQIEGVTEGTVVIAP